VRALQTGGKVGGVPDWYTHIRVAKYLGVAPWQLLEQSEAWCLWGLDAMNAETLAEKKPKKH
jgi:hypothetical protein